MTERQPLLTTRHLTVGYPVRRKPPRCIAGPLDLTVWSGELVCLLGPNGAGKSTLMRTLAGLQPALRGEITIEAQPLSSLKPLDLARHLSIVLTEQIDAGNLTVYDLVALGRFPYTGWLGKLTADDAAKVHWALAATDMLGFMGRQAHELSDGERQRAMLARALAQDTAVILLDEPTAHLDLPNRVSMMRLLHRLARHTKKAILLSTHELDLALQAADTLWLLDPDGTLAVGAPEDLVLSGRFEAAFAKTGFQFDRATGTFSLHNDTPGPAVYLSGESDLLFWTRRALQREGFTPTTTANNASITIEAHRQAGKPNWIIGQNGHRHTYTQLANLLDHLRYVFINKTQTHENIHKARG